jgi:hypothetical protein
MYLEDQGRDTGDLEFSPDINLYLNDYPELYSRLHWPLTIFFRCASTGRKRNEGNEGAENRGEGERLVRG